MARLLYRLGSAAFRHRWAVVAVWLVVLVGGIVGGAALSGPTSDRLEIPGRESTAAIAVMAEKFGSGQDEFAASRVVVQAPADGQLDSPENASSVAALVTGLRSLPGVLAVTDPLDPAGPTLSADLTTAYATVNYGVPAGDLDESDHRSFDEVLDSARTAGLTVEATGTAVPFEAHGASAEIVGIVVAFIVLLITFGGLVIAGMNLLTALVGVGIGFSGISVLSGFTELSATTPVLALMLGLAVGIDYALFLIIRFRQELRQGHDVATAVARATATAGSAVVTAGLTVIIALAGLGVVGIGFLTQMGLGAAFTVLIAVLVAITLLPAVLGILGRRALPRKERITSTPVPEQEVSGGFFQGWSRTVVRRPWAALVLTVVGLGTLSIPVLSMDTTLVPAPTTSTTQGRADILLADAYGPGINAPLTVLFAGDAAVETAAGEIEKLESLDDVAAVTGPVPNADGTAALVSVLPQSGPADQATETLVLALRTALADSPAQTWVTGSTAISIDVTDALTEALPIYLLLIVGLALILLILVFRSLWVPVIAVLGFLLALGASIGAAVAVFQWGWAKDLIGLETTGPILAITPILAIGILFGLAMDYQIFLVSRMHEAHHHGETARRAIGSGFRSAGPVVVAAALIMFGVFAAFMAGGDATIMSIGFILAAGVLFDAFVVRMILVPATLALLGDRAWSLPRWLTWLPRLDVEGAGLDTAPRSEQDRIGQPA